MARDIVVFTLHKSGSMFLHRQCEMLCAAARLDYHSPNAPASGLDARRLLTDRDLWRTRHGCFAPVRFYVDLPEIEKYEVLLHLRDPRDVLVSMFYSYCYIHPGAVAPNTGYRKAAAEGGIDAFVLAKASETSTRFPGDYGTGGHVEDLIGNLPRRYRDYIRHLLGRPNVTLLRYEEMVTNYPAWLAKFARPFPLQHRQAQLEEWAARASSFFPQRTGDVMSHVRHVMPGDYGAKLRPETIQRLDEIFSDALTALGYVRGISAQ
ncbi:MAG TPA: sulfotransferase domain-containing protein [Steroidobacteraceae bacterium]|nr:sulfotransferase domain-containing protein [Steroidobacteraceae bacterium]